MQKINDFISLYGIILSNDRNYYVCKNDSGQYFIEHKGDNTNGKLVFYSGDVAQSYIDKYLDSNKFKPERYICNIDYLPDNIIKEV